MSPAIEFSDEPASDPDRVALHAYVERVKDAIGGVDHSWGEFYIQAFVVAASDVPASVWRWEGGEYVETTTAALSDE